MGLSSKVSSGIERLSFPLLKRKTKIVVFERECFRVQCDQKMTLWFVNPDGLWKSHRIEAHPKIVEAVKRFTAGEGIEPASESAPLAVMKMVVTRPAGMYLGFCCPSCGIIQGDFYNTQAMFESIEDGTARQTFA